MKPEIVTFTGGVFNFQNISKNIVSIVDIAHSLSLQCRYTGHVRKFYSVAEHCWRMSVANLHGTVLSRLMHDAAEAYVGDIAAPFKQLLWYNGDDLVTDVKEYRGVNYPISRLEMQILTVICRDLDIAINVRNTKEANKIITATEVRDLMPKGHHKLFDGYLKGAKPLIKKIRPMSSRKAEKLFLKRYYELSTL